MKQDPIKVKIFNSDLGVSQDGKSLRAWYMKMIETENPRHAEELMGWTSTNSSQYQLKIRFNDLEAAVDYAKSKGYDYIIHEDKPSKVRKKSYADNFLKS